MAKPKLEKKVSIPNDILMDLLTPSEIRMLKNRYLIIQLLEEGLSIRKIAEKLSVGTDTVVRVARMKEKGNFKKSEDKKLPFRTNTPWIFGKSDN